MSRERHHHKHRGTVHGLLLERDAERREERHHEGGLAVDLHPLVLRRIVKIACCTGEEASDAFACDCCDRKAIGHIATTGGITVRIVRIVRGLMVATSIATAMRIVCLHRPEWQIEFAPIGRQSHA